jgi:hypothetical protein
MQIDKMTSTVRLYLDDGKTNPDVNMAHMRQQVHALFCVWVKSNYHVRDFLQALEHQSTAIFTDYLLGGSPRIPEDLLLSDDETLATLTPFFDEPMTEDSLKPRFYTADGHLNPEISLDEEFQAVFAQLFAHWVHVGNNPRDFINAVKDCGASTYHGYTICKSLNGMGGGKTIDQYINTRPNK